MTLPRSTPRAAAHHRITINDVAKAAGVSKATVSRYMNGGGTQLAAETAARVAEVIRLMGYKPSPMAQSLKHGRTRLIGLAVADITNPFSIAVLRGAEQACQASGYLIVLFNLGNEAARERGVMHALETAQLDGLILNRVHTSAQIYEEAQASGKPIVLVDRQQTGMDVDFISVDNTAAVYTALDHLRQQGWRNFLLITEQTLGVSSRSARKKSFYDWLAEQPAGADNCQGQHLEISDPGLTTDPNVLAWLQAAQAKQQPAAILSSNAIATLYTMGVVQSYGWQLGQDLGFVGIDETEWATLIGPGLTTIAQPTDQLGQLAVQCLVERMAGDTQPARHIQLPGQLIVRRSSQAATR
ncbi:MAG: LacI family DNA-binding transcriptional regulator [Comamonas sp.]|nr:LacI family DNA-binding transcriptional regulator [Comamonas sp.]